MRRHGSYRRRRGIGEPFPLAQEPVPRVLRDESDSDALPLSEGEDGPLPLTEGETGPLPLIYGEVGFEPVADESGHIDPLNPEPMA